MTGRERKKRTNERYKKIYKIQKQRKMVLKMGCLKVLKKHYKKRKIYKRYSKKDRKKDAIK